MDRPERLPRRVRALLADTGNEILVSVVSLWEIAVKHALSNRSLARGRADAIRFTGAEALRCFEEAGCAVLGLAPAHVLALEGLPALHRDPFDRMLAAQALAEPLRLVTHDAALAAYSDSFIAF